MSSYSEGQTHQLMEALERAGWTPEDVTRLGQSCTTRLNDIRRVLLGRAEIRSIEHLHLIDLDADPFVPTGWQVEEHQKGGQLVWDPGQITLWLAEKQKTGWIKGTDLKKELEGQPVLPAQVLDFLLQHPALIPEEWKNKITFFWGTIYRVPGSNLYVRYLYWCGRRWDWSCRWLGSVWRAAAPALLLAS